MKIESFRRRHCFNTLMLLAFLIMAQSLAAAEATMPTSPTQTTKSTSTPEIWMSMRHGVPDLAAPRAQWDFVKQHLDGFKLMRSNVFKYATPDQLRATIAILNENKIPIHMEVGGPMPQGTVSENEGREAAQADLRTCIEPVASLGGNLQILDLDWQVHELLKKAAKTWPDETPQQLMDRAAGFMVDYMRTINAAHPDIRFSLLSNFPNWRWKGGPNCAPWAAWGDYWEVVSTVVPRCREAKVPLISITVDFPYNFTLREGPDWLARIREMEDYARSQNLEFNLIINCQDGGGASDQLFYENTLKYLDAYRAANGHPNRYIVQSWYDYPKTINPEDKKYSMTNLVKEVIERTQKFK